MQLRFRLRANPTKRISKNNKDQAAQWHGKRIEMRETGALFADPESAYARDLIAAAPDLDAAIAQRA